MSQFIFFLFSFLSVAAITPLVRRFALRHAILDRPERHPERKIHQRAVPLLGGLALIASVLLGLVIAWQAGLLFDGKIEERQMWGVLIASMIIAIGGYLDDRHELSPLQTFVWTLAVGFITVGSGITIHYVTNPLIAGTGPFGRALLYFDSLTALGISLGSIIAFVWLLTMMYVTKFLDGLDGLVSGIGIIGSLVLFIVSLYWDVPGSGTSVIALLLAGSCAGFLIFNWHPAKIFLGESGSVYIGFMLGVLSIISGAKIATTLLVMGIPLLDVVWVVLRRIVTERRTPFHGDRKHFHFRLLDIGLSHRQAVSVLYALSAVFGMSSLFLQSTQKVIALAVMGVIMLILAVIVVFKAKNRMKNQL